MEFNLTPDTQGRQTQIVSSTDTSIHFGSGLIEVFATPAMIALMEKTAQLSIQSQLPEGFISLGTEISVSHVKATLVGKIVRCESVLKSAEGKKLLFSVKVWDEKELIGEGIHRRYIVNALEFMDKLVGERDE
ncbi:MAG: thioesterase family protein [Lentimicrobium sp.]|jgi:predicted thioesterase|nr:thioesterase family protein [Lentimicrobium sp.]